MKGVQKLLLLLGFLLLLLSACGSKKEKTSLELGEVNHIIFYAPQYVALEKGFFDEEGLDVSLKTVWGGDKAMTALLSEDVDVALIGAETSMYVYGQDSKDYAVNFAQLTQTDGTFLVSKEEHPDFAWDDVKNSHYLGQRKGGMPQMVREYVLKQHDIDPQSDLDLQQNIDLENLSSAFVSGDAQYVQLFEPQASVFEQEGKGHVTASFGEESGFIPYTTFMTKQSLIDEDPVTVKRFTKAIYKAQT